MSAWGSFLKIFKKKDSRGGTRLLDQVKLSRVKPYGDLLDDGAMQLSFTLPLAVSPEAKEAAKQYVEKMGMNEVHVATMEKVGDKLSFFVVYGHASHTINFNRIKVVKAEFEAMDFDQVNAFAEKNIKKRLVVIGATTGTDAHTVGIDAIMNMKGYMGDPGLERYPCFKAINLRSQVSNEELVRQAGKYLADVILVSKVVTQRGEYLKELKELGKLIKEKKKSSSPLVKIAGGPRMTQAQAAKLGFDAGFGPGTLPSQVASFLVQDYHKKMKRIS